MTLSYLNSLKVQSLIFSKPSKPKKKVICKAIDKYLLTFVKN